MSKLGLVNTELLGDTKRRFGVISAGSTWFKQV